MEKLILDKNFALQEATAEIEASLRLLETLTSTYMTHQSGEDISKLDESCILDPKSRKYEIGLRAWDSPIRNFGISDLRCRVHPISRSRVPIH